jgi:CheY-like chemotaxis protein
LKLHKTDQGRLELAAAARTLSQRERTLVLLADGRKSIADFEHQFGVAAGPYLRDLIARGFLIEKDDQVSPSSPVRLDFGPPSAFISESKGATAPRATEIESQAPAKPADKRAVQLLIVDDSEVAVRAMQNQLRHYAALVQVASSGTAALALLPTAEFAIVFLDVMMPGMDGYQTCRAIKQFRSPGGKVPAVVLQSSRGGVVDKIRGSMARADGYLTKPLHSGDLAAMMRKFAPGAILPASQN